MEHFTHTDHIGHNHYHQFNGCEATHRRVLLRSVLVKRLDALLESDTSVVRRTPLALELILDGDELLPILPEIIGYDLNKLKCTDVNRLFEEVQYQLSTDHLYRIVESCNGWKCVINSKHASLTYLACIVSTHMAEIDDLGNERLWITLIASRL